MEHLTRLIVIALTALGAHHITVTHCGHRYCYGRLDVASVYFTTPARCRYSVNYRPRLRVKTATVYRCEAITKWQLMSDSDTAKRATLATENTGS